MKRASTKQTNKNQPPATPMALAFSSPAAGGGGGGGGAGFEDDGAAV